MSNKTKDILDEVLDVAESTTELVEKKPDTLTIKRADNLEDVDADNRYIKAQVISTGNLVEGIKDNDVVYYDKHAAHGVYQQSLTGFWMKIIVKAVFF